MKLLMGKDNAKIVIRLSTGDNYEIHFKLTKTIQDFRQYIQEKFKLSPKIRIIFQNIILNDYASKTLREVGIEENAELVILNCKQKYYFDEVKEEGERKRKKSRIDYPKVFGSKTKIDPDKLEVTQQLIAHCTDAKQRALHVNRGHLHMSDLMELLERRYHHQAGSDNSGDQNPRISLGGLFSSSAQVIPDPQKVTQLTEMGFDPDLAKECLKKASNSINVAIEYLTREGGPPAPPEAPERRPREGSQQPPTSTEMFNFDPSTDSIDQYLERINLAHVMREMLNGLSSEGRNPSPRLPPEEAKERQEESKE